MRLLDIVGVAAIGATVQGLSIPDGPQHVLAQSNVWGTEGQPLLEQLSAQLDKLGLDSKKDVVSAWKAIQHEFSPESIQNKIHEYEQTLTVQSSRLHNQMKAFGKSFMEAGFEKVEDNKFDQYSLRVKESSPEILGLDSVKQYTGYLDVNDLDKHFFYWFFESRNDPENDPVILWLNGGPGCSSATGLFFELGPSLINATLQPVFNPYSWNNNASVIFLDQPVGVGYSYTGGDSVKSTASAAKDVYVFLELFFQKFPQFVKNDFHISGESYAGHYIPKFATEIINQADRSFELTSVLIGNGITDSLIQNAAYKPMGCGEGGYKAVLEPEICDQMEVDYPKCAALTALCYKFPNALTCVPANLYCETKLFSPYANTGLNPYDIRRKCDNEGGECYDQMLYVEDYLNLDYVKNAVGASNIDIFSSCDETVFRNFIVDGDEAKPFQQYVAELLEFGIPVLIYAGDKDYICNWLGNHAWTDALDYSNHEEFEAEKLKPWYTQDNKLAGEVKNFDKFTFLRVYDAGHMVPFDQPESSLDMVNRWIQGDYSYGY